MLVPLSRRRTVWAAYCDACLVGSPPIPFDAPHLARQWAIGKLGALGWTHVMPPNLPPAGARIAAAAWTGETFCFECSSRAARMRKPA